MPQHKPSYNPQFHDSNTAKNYQTDAMLLKTGLDNGVRATHIVQGCQQHGTLFQGRRKMIKVRGARRRASMVQAATRRSAGILSQEFFLTLQFLFAFWVQIYLEIYENTMTVTHIVIYLNVLIQ